MNKRISIIFMITDKCNCNCFFCSRNNLSRQYYEPNIQDIYNVFDILSQAYPSSKLIISGGEPTLSKNFLKILKYATLKFEKIEIQTNGTFSQQIADELKIFLNENVYLQFSLDGVERFHDLIRGDGVFGKVVDNLLYLQDFYSHLSISTTVTPLNIESALELTKYLNGYKFRRLTVSYVQPLNPKNERVLSSATWNKFVDALLRCCYYRVDISKLYDFELMDKFLETGKKWNGIVNCGRGITHFYVTPTFDVVPCTCTNFTVGNLLSDDIAKIRKELALIEKIVVDTKSVCSKCKYLQICNGGCPGLSMKVFGKENMGDVRCPKVYEFAASNGLILNEV